MDEDDISRLMEKVGSVALSRMLQEIDGRDRDPIARLERKACKPAAVYLKLQNTSMSAR